MVVGRLPLRLRHRAVNTFRRNELSQHLKNLKHSTMAIFETSGHLTNETNLEHFTVQIKSWYIPAKKDETGSKTWQEITMRCVEFFLLCPLSWVGVNTTSWRMASGKWWFHSSKFWIFFHLKAKRPAPSIDDCCPSIIHRAQSAKTLEGLKGCTLHSSAKISYLK